jgi:nucleoside-diphosphate-sugar epimerase
MSKRAKRKMLVTGSTGQIGSELTLELRKRYGGDNVIAIGHRRPPSEVLLNSGPFEYVDLSAEENVERVVKKYDIDTLYHLAAVLSATGEQNPQAAWATNMGSLYNVLEVARKEMLGVFWPSSIAVFGPTTPRSNTPQETVLTPGTIYGITKVAGELLCNYYSMKYGVDVRSIRYPGIISSEVLPGGGTTDYAVEMFYEALKMRHYVCFVREDTVLPMMYMPDCLKATIDLMEADRFKVKRRDGYNVAGVSFSAEDLAAEIKKHVNDFKCEYKPDFRQKIADSWPMSIDDSAARRDWGWKPEYNLVTMTKDMIAKLSKRLAEDKL